MSENETKSALPTEGSQKAWGFFGYPGACCDIAISRDVVPALIECIERGYMRPETRTLTNMSMVRLAQFRGAKRCEAELLKRGWPSA